MTLAEPSARQTDRGDGATITLSGDWIAPNAPAMNALAEMPKGTPQRVTIDAAGIGRIDTYGAWSINAMATAAGARGAPADIVGLADEPATVLRQVAEASRQALPAPPRAGIVDFFETFGRVLFEIGGDSLSMLALFGSIVMSLAGVIARPRTLRWRSVVHNLDQMGVRAVPIVALMTFLVGCIIAQQGFFNFRKFGATDYVVDMVTILVLREIGVLLVTIMVAGRSGSACTAEIGSMKMREEIDALRTMGLDPIDVLVLPRVLALVIAVPILTFIAVLAALYGAGLVAATYGEMSVATFLARLRETVTFSDFEVGLIKAPVMALVIGTVASLEGLRVEGSTSSLGARTTASVVKSIFLVIVLDGLFAVLFAAVGL